MKKFSIHDNWETPEHVFRDFAQSVSIPRSATIWDPFYSTGRAGNLLRAAFPRHTVVHQKKDFFATPLPAPKTVVITNPPYSMNKKVIDELVSRSVPFAVFVRSDTMFTSYMQTLFRENPGKFRIYVPKGRTHFIDPSTGKQVKGVRFLSLWITYDIKPRGTSLGAEIHLM